jgi:2-succinyl-5-enolpyruvyl-6-hydroxy-3-cyclohexene-1-carboxylate synthase
MVGVMSDTSPTENAAPASPEQRRAAKRMRVLKSGKIVLDDRRAIDCTLRDVSATGAKLVCSVALEMPDKFRLYIAADNTIRDVQIAWKEKGLLGITFVGEPKSAALRKF